MEQNPSSSTKNQTQKHQHSLSDQTHKTHHGNFHSNSILIITVSMISSIIVVVAIIVIIILMIRRLKSAKKDATKFKENDIIHNTSSRFIAHTSVNFSSSPGMKGGCLKGGNIGRNYRGRGIQVFTYKEIEKATESFGEGNVIGKGGSGVVFRGILIDGTVAAIKLLHTDQPKLRERSFRIEVDLLTRMHCPYLVELLGYCADQNHRLLIFELMPNGTLHHHLHPSDKNSQPLDWGTRLRIALDCARALEFLHEFAVPSVIHRDFKSTHVLLDQNFRAKVSDFGSAKMGSDKINGQISIPGVWTTGYLAPEYTSMSKITTKSDVYSYGVVLLELLTGRLPIDTRRPVGQQVLVSWALPRLTNREKIVEMVDPTLRGKYSKKALIQIAAIAAMCVQAEAEYRPLMTDVVHSLVPLVNNISSIPSSTSLTQTHTPRYLESH